MPKIAVSYRREDSEAMTGRIVDRLIAHYGKDAIFRDIDNIPPGIDFRVHLNDVLLKTHILLAIVGPRWLGATERSLERIQEESDPVRVEVETALRRRVPIIPVLIGSTRMPSNEQLPPSLKDFAFRNAMKVDVGQDFDHHMDRVLGAIDFLLKRSAGSSSTAGPPARKLEHITAERPIPVPPDPQVRAASAQSSVSASGVQSLTRNSPDFWLHRVAADRKLKAGDQPLIVISFASEDQRWVDDLRAFLDPRIELLRDGDGQAYSLWNFSDAKRGTSPGDEFPEIVAEKMWRCRAALIVFSSSYFRSNYCRSIELPFLMWRREHHKLMCLPLKLGVLPVDRVRIPGFEGPQRSVIIDELIDDRQAAANFASSKYRNFSLKQLREEGIESEIESRFEGISRRVADCLKQQFFAVEVD
jgi:hypothetical protein